MNSNSLNKELSEDSPRIPKAEDLSERLAQLAEQALVRRAERLAEEDLGWWVERIAKLVRIGAKHGAVTDEHRWLWNRRARTSQAYTTKLECLLGEPFRVKLKTVKALEGDQVVRTEVSW